MRGDAATIARALGGKSCGGGYLVHCPVSTHGKGRGDLNPSLHVSDGECALLVKCFACCDPRDVIDTLRRRGLIEDREQQQQSPRSKLQAATLILAPHDPDPEALEIWRATKIGADSLIEKSYLRWREITIACPPSLRCGQVSHLNRYTMPAMIAAVQRPDGKIVAVQATLLTSTGKKASVSKPRITTGALGAGAVRFAKADIALGLGEGVETVLSAMQMTGLPCWACLGAGRMHRVAIPDYVRELHIFADNDDPGRAAAERTAHANRHRRVVLHFPPDGCNDWNDALVAGARTAP